MKATFLKGPALQVAFDLGLELQVGDWVVIGPDETYDNQGEQDYHGRPLRIKAVGDDHDYTSSVVCVVRASGCNAGMDPNEFGVTRNNIVGWRRPKRRKK